MAEEPEYILYVDIDGYSYLLSLCLAVDCVY